MVGRHNAILPMPCTYGTLPWQPFLDFYIWGAHWRHLANTTVSSICGGDADLCQITLTTFYVAHDRIKSVMMMMMMTMFDWLSLISNTYRVK